MHCDFYLFIFGVVVGGWLVLGASFGFMATPQFSGNNLALRIFAGIRVRSEFYFFGPLWRAVPLNFRNYTVPSTEAKRHCCAHFESIPNLPIAPAPSPPLLPGWTSAIMTLASKEQHPNLQTLITCIWLNIKPKSMSVVNYLGLT